MEKLDKAAALVNELHKHKLSLCTAESCTGGGIADRITDVPGASQVFVGAVVAYTPEAKSILLNLPAEDIPPGAVGEKLTVAMAAQAKSLLGTDLALGVTGALGPASPAENIRVGQIFISIAGLGHQEVKQFNFAGDRQTIKEAAVNAGIDFLLAYIARWYIA